MMMMITAATAFADEYWRLHCSDYKQADEREKDVARCRDLHQQSLANCTCACSWRLVELPQLYLCVVRPHF
jgi:2-iminoacetate synthase ThiH